METVRGKICGEKRYFIFFFGSGLLALPQTLPSRVPFPFGPFAQGIVASYRRSVMGRHGAGKHNPPLTRHKFPNSAAVAVQLSRL